MRASLAFVVLTLARPVAALFEDQAGKIDWGRQNLGRTTSALFHTGSGQRLALVSTEAGVVAGVDLRTGETNWRRVLPEGESVSQLISVGKSNALSVGIARREGGPVGTVRMWSPLGALIWDAIVGDVAGDRVPAIAVGESAVYVGSGATVVALQAATGAELWRWRAASDRGASFAIVQLVARLTAEGGMGSLHAVAVLEKPGAAPTLVAASLSPSEGKQLERHEIRSAEPVAPADEIRLTLTPDSSKLLTLSRSAASLLLLSPGAQKLEALPLSAVLPPGISAAALLPARIPGTAAIRCSDGSVSLLSLPRPGSPLSLLRALPASPAATSVASASWGETGGAVLAVVAAAPDASVTVETMTLGADGMAVGEWSPVQPCGAATPDAAGGFDAWLHPYNRKDGSVGSRLLLSTVGAALQLLSPSAGAAPASAAWVREEALAAVTGAWMLPLPAVPIDVDDGTPFFGFGLPGVIEGVRDKLALLQLSAEDAAAKARARALRGDAYGTRQVVVVTTSASKLLGLHSSTGEVLWTLYVPPLSPGGPHPTLRAVFIDGSGAKATILALATDAQRYSLLTLNPFTGAVLSRRDQEGSVIHAAQLPAAPVSANHRTLLIVDSELKVAVHPDTDHAKAELAAAVPTTFFYLVSPTQVQGFGLTGAAGGGVRASQRWAVALPRGSRTTTSYFGHEAAIHSPTRTKGDRTVLHKYINRNLLAVGMEVDASGGTEPYVQAMLLDTVSGRVLYTARHSASAGPLSILLGENSLLYSYTSASQPVLTSAELFVNSSVADDPLSLLLAGPVDTSLRANQFDAFAALPPKVQAQSYAFSTAVAALGITLTHKGITPKHILIGTAAGHILAYDNRMFDPRRPFVHPSKMSAQDKEEGLVPYSPSLGGINGQQVISHRNTVARPRAIVTGPTMLESTSLVFAYGLDLFLTRATPARTFDMLGEDFNKIGLLGATAAMAVATVASGWYVARKELAAAWA